MRTNRLTPASFAAATRSRVPCFMIRSKGSCRGSAMIATRWITRSHPSTARRRLSASVTSPAKSSQPQFASVFASAEGGPGRARGPPVLRAERVHDVAAHEPGSPCDQDHAKFFQWRLGVGPSWPWYFDPIVSAP